MKLKSILDFSLFLYIVLCLKGVGLISYPFFLFKKLFVYLCMEQYINEAELIGSQLEQQYYEQQLEQLKNQLILRQ